MARDLKLMDELFFPYAKIFNQVINYYINNVLADEISDTMREAIGTKELWQKALKKESFTINYSLDELELLYNTLKKDILEQDYDIPGLDQLKKDVKEQINKSIQFLFNVVTEKIYTKSGNIDGRKKFKITYNPKKLCVRKSGGSKYPLWWPTTATIPTKHVVTEEMKNLVINTLFPHLVKHSQETSGKVGIDKNSV